MDLKYVLSYHDRIIGNVLVDKIGLYYHITCRFSLTETGPFRLIMVTEKGETDLGVCRQYESQLGTERHFPIKTVGERLRKFYITKERVSTEVPVSENEPFPYIARLDSAILIVKNNEKWIKL